MRFFVLLRMAALQDDLTGRDMPCGAICPNGTRYAPDGAWEGVGLKHLIHRKRSPFLLKGKARGEASGPPSPKGKARYVVRCRIQQMLYKDKALPNVGEGFPLPLK